MCDVSQHIQGDLNLVQLVIDRLFISSAELLRIWQLQLFLQAKFKEPKNK